jgi:hypothetical protein
LARKPDDTHYTLAEYLMLSVKEEEALAGVNITDVEDAGGGLRSLVY